MSNSLPIKVLLADGNSSHRTIMHKYLESTGIISLESGDGRDAMEKILVAMPDLVIFDLSLPVLSGMECLSLMKKNAEMDTIPVILCSSRTDEATATLCFSAGCAALIGKPLAQKHFLSAVRSALQREAPALFVASATVDTVGIGSSEQDRDEVLAVGNYEEESDGEEIAISSRHGDECSMLKPSPELMELIQARLSVFKDLHTLEERRTMQMKLESLPESMQGELRRQRVEAVSLPKGEQARVAMESRKRQLEEMKSKIQLKEISIPATEVMEIHQCAMKQWNLFVCRDALLPKLLSTASAMASGEPLYHVFRQSGIDARNLFGWAIYARCLESLIVEQGQKKEVLRRKAESQPQNQAGFLNRLKRGADEKSDLPTDFEQHISGVSALISYLQRELTAVEKPMVDEFWKIYEPAACLFVEHTVSQDNEALLRAFLRYGLLCISPQFLPVETVRFILKGCASPVKEYGHSMKSNHVLFADEYIDLVASYKAPPSIDEELELNHQNSPEWKADKFLRKLINTQLRGSLLKELGGELAEKCRFYRTKQKAVEAEIGRITSESSDYKLKASKLGDEAQSYRVESARLERALELIKTKYLPKQQEISEDSHAKLQETGTVPDKKTLAVREAKAIRKICKLCARLKEPFLPFALRDNFKRENGLVNEREPLIERFQEAEKRDPTIFLEELFPVKKVSQRIYLRFAPVVLISPACGYMHYSWNPRSTYDAGRLVIPGYVPRSGVMDRIFPHLLADFRYDTSKLNAGIDLLTSDTLVASYASIRWNYRKKKKEIREKAAIYMEESDRLNWRRHYSLFFESAEEAGKKLFFKNLEVYESVMKYIGLPEGVERLKH